MTQSTEVLDSQADAIRLGDAERNLNTSSTGNALSSPGGIVEPAATGKSKGGAPKGNQNARRHFARYGLFMPRSPKGSQYIDRAVSTFRRHLEDCLMAEHGEISIHDSCLIDSASQAARVALSELQELRELFDSMDAGQRSAKRQAALKALDLRDKKVKELGITWRPEVLPADDDPFRVLDEETQIAKATSELEPKDNPSEPN